MDIVTFVLYTMAILELLFFLLTMYHLIKGLQTKNYNELKYYTNIKDMKFKNIYVCAYKFNMTIDKKSGAMIPLIELSAILDDINKIYVISPYTKDNSKG